MFVVLIATVLSLSGCFAAFLVFGTMAVIDDAAQGGGIDYEVPDEAERAPLRERAERGNVAAARRLALDYREPETLQVLASAGNPAAQFAMFEMLERSGVASDPLRDGPRRALALLCSAANEGYRPAQAKLGDAHRSWPFNRAPRDDEWARPAGIQPDTRVAYMWYALAGDVGTTRYWEVSVRDEVIREAKALVAAWRPGQCPRP